MAISQLLAALDDRFWACVWDVAERIRAVHGPVGAVSEVRRALLDDSAAGGPHQVGDSAAAWILSKIHRRCPSLLCSSGATSIPLQMCSTWACGGAAGHAHARDPVELPACAPRLVRPLCTLTALCLCTLGARGTGFVCDPPLGGWLHQQPTLERSLVRPRRSNSGPFLPSLRVQLVCSCMPAGVSGEDWDTRRRLGYSAGILDWDTRRRRWDTRCPWPSCVHQEISLTASSRRRRCSG